MTDDTYLWTEPTFPIDYGFPVGVSTINRFQGIDGRSHEQLVIVPAQFQAYPAVTPTMGIERLYSNLEFEIYHALFDNTDFIPPAIWQVRANRVNDTLVNFGAVVADDVGASPRVIILYRELSDTTWQKLEMIYDPARQIVWAAWIRRRPWSTSFKR